MSISNVCLEWDVPSLFIFVLQILVCTFPIHFFFFKFQTIVQKNAGQVPEKCTKLPHSLYNIFLGF